VVFASTQMSLLERLRSFVGDERGQDLIEYALLGAFVGLAGLTVFSVVKTQMGTKYNQWNVGTQNIADMPDPAP